MPDTAPLRWELPHQVRIAMSQAVDGDLRPGPARQAWCRHHGIPPPWIARQVHGTQILSTPFADDQAVPDGDAVVSDGAAIAVFGADCPPLVLAAPDALLVAHCGWQGCARGIVDLAIAALRRRSQHPPAAWSALIGPAAHPDDYEVDNVVLQTRSWPAGSLRAGRPGHAWLDLPAAIAADCLSAGLGMVARCALCTSRDPRLRSHRRDGRGFPQMLVTWRAATCVG